MDQNEIRTEDNTSVFQGHHLQELRVNLIRYKFEVAWYCRLCYQVYYDSSNLYQHFEDEHGDVMEITTNLTTQATLWLISENFTTKNESADDISPSSIPKRKNKEIRKFSCKRCNELFSHSSHLKHHQMLHAGKKLFTCYKCKKHFTRKYNLKVHTLIHLRKKSHVCDLCNESFSTDNKLKKHNRIHSDKMH